MFDRLLKKFLPQTSKSNEERSDELLPPRSLQEFVGGAYKEVGDEFLRYLIELCGLKPHESVLDIGCGSGRIAVPLTRYLNNAGQYRGFDVSEKAIDWCGRNVTRRFTNFEFEVADIQNGPYNPQGKFKPSEYRFPYPDQEFDVAFLASVFTHMLPADVRHYMAEIARVLKPGGRCLSTFFLLSGESLELTGARKGTYNFEHEGVGYRSINADQPEEGVAYPDSFIVKLFEGTGLKVEFPLHYGSWCGREKFLSFQDIVITTKPVAPVRESTI